MDFLQPRHWISEAASIFSESIQASSWKVLQRVTMKITTIQDHIGTRENNYDFLRFMAAVLVVLSHAYILSLGNYSGEFLVEITNKQASLGFVGVGVFFIISGFLISQSYFSSRNPAAFIKARVLRIFPALAVVVLLTTFVLGPVLSTVPLETYLNDPRTGDYLKNIFLFPKTFYYLPGTFEENPFKGAVNGSIYTLRYEAACYVMVLVLGLLRILRIKEVVLLSFAAGLYIIFISPDLIPKNMLMGMGKNFIFFVFFMAGMVFYSFRNFIPLHWSLFLASAGFLAAALFLGNFRNLFVIFGAYMVFYIAYNSKIRLHRLSKYGDFSYGIYIYAFPIQQTVTLYNGGQMSPLLNFLISLPLSLICAFLSWHLVEKHSLKLKKHGLMQSVIHPLRKYIAGQH